MNQYIKMGLDLKIISIDDVKQHTTLELIFLMIKRINEMTDGLNNLEVSIHQEVADLVNELMQDKELANIITTYVIPEVKDNAIDVKAHGVKGDGLTDDSNAIQSLIDEVTVASNSGIVPNGTIRLRFPKGLYLISKPIKIKGSVQIDASGAIIKATQVMDAMIQIDSETQI